MVARIETGKSIRGVLNYNENKVAVAEAELLLASGFPRSPDRLNFNNKLDIFEKLTRQNERTKTNTLHITLNFSIDDKLDNDLLQQIAADYMKGIGFGEQPFLVYRHYDAAHPHIHIATVNIADGGERIETHNIGRDASNRTRKQLEETYGLVRAENQKKEQAYTIRPVDLQRIVYGKQETKQAISAVVREVVRTYKFTSLTELNAILGQFNVLADRGKPESKMFENKGLIYSLINERGERIGVPIKASIIYGKPTLPQLEKLFTENKISRKPYGERLKFLLDRTVGKASDMQSLENELRRQGIRILFRKNVLGNIYGITFIDNATRVVFNGSDLGKQYSAQAFMERLSTFMNKTKETENPVSSQNTANRQSDNKLDNMEEQSSAGLHLSNPSNQKNQDNLGSDLPVIQTMLDIMFYDEHEQSNYDPLKKKKKKQLQAQ
ncbi:MAG TPA: relaxase/mobilization nuclease domain-containing protein [Arachidicoccus sp.]